MPVTTLSAWDFNTNTKLTDLPYKEASYAVRLNDAGEASVTVDLADAKSSSPVGVLQSLGGNPFKLVYAQGPQILHEAYIYRYQMQDDSLELKLTGSGLTSVYSFILNDAIGVGLNAATASNDPANLIKAVVAAGPGYITTRFAIQNWPPKTTYTYSKDTTAGQLLADATAAVVPGTGGVDWAMEHRFVNSQPVATMAIYAPRAGHDRHTSGWSVDLTKARSWKWYTDAQKMTTTVVAVGSGAGTGAAVRSKQTVPRPIGGLGQSPNFTGVFQFSGVNDQARIGNIAHGLLSVYGNPVAAPVVTVPIDHPSLPLGGVGIGDDVLLTAPQCQHFPNGLNQWWRIVAYRVTLPSEGVPVVEYTFNLPPVF